MLDTETEYRIVSKHPPTKELTMDIPDEELFTKHDENLAEMVDMLPMASKFNILAHIGASLIEEVYTTGDEPLRQTLVETLNVLLTELASSVPNDEETH